MVESVNVDSLRFSPEPEEEYEFVEAEGFVDLSDVEYQSSNETDTSPRESLSPRLDENLADNNSANDGEGEAADAREAGDEGEATGKDDNTIDVDALDMDRNTDDLDSDLENRRLLVMMKFTRFLARKDELIERLTTQNTKLIKKIQGPRATTSKLCPKVGKFCASHLIPPLGLYFKFYAGHESDHPTKKWLTKIEKYKELYKWTDKTTIEVARYYLMGEASVWADNVVGDCDNWINWANSFKKRFLMAQMSRRLTIESFANFLNYREVVPTQIFARRMVVHCVDGVTRPAPTVDNPFSNFRNNKKTLKHLYKLHQKRGETYDAPEDLVQLKLVIKTCIEKVQDLDEEKLNNNPTLKAKVERVLERMCKQARHDESTKKPKRYVGNGPFAEPELLHPKREKALKDVIGKDYSYYWTEWYLHLCLSDRITSIVGNLEVICIGKKRYKGYIDLHTPFSTIVASAAVNKNYDLYFEHIQITYKDGRTVDSYSYFYDSVCLKPYNLTGRARFRIVPDDSQCAQVIVGRSLTMYPLYYCDKNLKMTRVERKKMDKECPEREYTIPFVRDN